MRLLILLYVALLASPAAAQTFGETRQYFRDWLAACRPDGYCSATAYDNLNPGDGSVADYILRVGRQPDGENWEISFSTIAAMPDRFSEILATVDKQVISFGKAFGINNFEGRIGAFDAINDFYFTGSNAQILFDNLIAGARANVQFTTEDESNRSGEFSLSGLSAALLWMDEQQDRLGSDRTASAPPVGLTPVDAEHGQIVPSALIKQHGADEDCDPYEFLPNAHDTIQGQSENGENIYFLPCTSGVYNYAYKAYEEINGSYFPLLFAQFNGFDGWTGTPYIINPKFDDETSILTTFYKGRGLGDCGATGIWKWTGYSFAMREYRFKEACDGQGEPGQFPVVFQAKSAN